MRKRLTIVSLSAALAVALALALVLLVPRLSALSLILRVAKPDTWPGRLAYQGAHEVREDPIRTLPTRHGPLDSQLFSPVDGARRTVILVPGVHMDGVREQRLVGLARQLAATGVRVLTVGPPDLMRYRLSPNSTDELEDAMGWAAGQPQLAPDGRVAIVGFSFAGGLALVAAGRPSVRSKVAAVLSFGGHADLARVLRYVCAGAADAIPADAARLAIHGDRIRVPAPHAYSPVVALLNLAPWMVPPEQVAGLQAAATTFLRASTLERTDRPQALAAFTLARQQGQALPEPARTLMGDANTGELRKLGEALRPMLSAVDLPAAVSPARSPLPTAPVFLLHGTEDSIIPATELLALVRLLAGVTEVHAFASQLITHADATNAIAIAEFWRLAGFWSDFLRR